MRPPLSLATFPAAALGLVLAGVGAASAQQPVPPPRPVPPPVAGGRADDPSFASIARRMADEVRRLADDLAIDLEHHPARRHMIEDSQELAQSLDDFRRDQRRGQDAILTRQTYSGIQASWRHLRDQVDRSRESSQVIDRDMQRIDALDAEVSQALGLNAIPIEEYAPAPDGGQGVATRRLARSLVDRAEGLALAVQADSQRDPNARALAADADRLAREADAWHDSLAANRARGDAARSFAPVSATAARLESYVTARPVSRRVSDSWQAFQGVETLVLRDLGLPPHQEARVVAVPGVRVETRSRPVVVQSPLPGLADVLVEQVEAYVQVFAPTADGVPEGRKMLDDANRLLAASSAFREEVARGADPNALIVRFRDVDAPSQRLARRVNRIAQGRTGPNIRQVNVIAATCEQIHQALGMPAVAPVYRPY